MSAGCFFRAFYLLSVTDPTSSVLADLRRRYNRDFPVRLDLVGHPFRSTMAAIHSTVGRVGGPRSIWWHNHRPSNQEHTPLARHMAEAAQAYERTSLRKVPRWIIRFALHSLSLDPLPLAPVIADCLTIVAIDLGCSVSNTTISNDRCVRILWPYTSLTKKQWKGGTDLNPHLSKARKPD